MVSAEAVRIALDDAAAHRYELNRHEPSTLLFAVADCIADDAEHVASLISSESGLSLRDTRHEVQRGHDVVPGFRTEFTPFGGIGDSGLGVKEGVRETIRALTVGKLVSYPW